MPGQKNDRFRFFVKRLALENETILAETKRPACVAAHTGPERPHRITSKRQAHCITCASLLQYKNEKRYTHDYDEAIRKRNRDPIQYEHVRENGRRELLKHVKPDQPILRSQEKRS